MESQISRMIKILKTDNDLEFFNDEYDQFCKINEILRQKKNCLLYPLEK